MNFPEASGAIKNLKQCPHPPSPDIRFFFLWSHHPNKHASCVVAFFHLDDKILYIDPKHTFKEFEIIRNKYKEDSSDGKESEHCER